MTHTHVSKVVVFSAIAFFVGGCGSSGGSSQPPAPPAPVAPPPPPPEPTFESRLADLAAFDPNGCRAGTPGFEALGGWLKNDGRELGRSRVWVADYGAHDATFTLATAQDNHGAVVWTVFSDCAVRSTEEQYVEHTATSGILAYREAGEDGRDAIISLSAGPNYEDIPLPAPEADFLTRYSWYDGQREDGQRIMEIAAAGNDNGKRTGWMQDAVFQGALAHSEVALRIIVGGYTGEGDDREPRLNKQTTEGLFGSSICSDAAPLCLFAPYDYDSEALGFALDGTSVATPQVSAALDSVWAVWPDMDILDLRNLAFDCAENMPARDGDTSTDRTYSYSNGREFTTTTNSTWGHGVLSLTCLFTPNGGLQDPTTGEAIAGGIIGPIAGPIVGASITGLDYTGRGFGYGFARPVARENFALAATANLRAFGASLRSDGLRYTHGAYHGNVWQSGAFRVDLTAAGNAIGLAAQWQVGNMTIRSGIATQPEGVGSLIGSRAFRAPTTVSAAITAAYGKVLPHGLSAHIQADHWRTLATQARSLWEGADLNESRVTAALVKRAGRHEFGLQGVWRSGLSGSLDIRGRNWAVSPQRETGMWLTWRLASSR